MGKFTNHDNSSEFQSAAPQKIDSRFILQPMGGLLLERVFYILERVFYFPGKTIEGSSIRILEGESSIREGSSIDARTVH